MHAGIQRHAVGNRYGLFSAETVNGVTYLNLPCQPVWLSVVVYGAPLEGMFRPRDYLTGHRFVHIEYTFDLV